MEVGVGRGVGDGRRDDLALGERGAVVHGDDADDVVGVLDDDRLEAIAALDQGRHRLEQLRVVGVERDRKILLLGEDDELREIEGIGALAQDFALRALMATALQKRAGVGEIGSFDVEASVWVEASGAPSRANT